jgi:NADPH2:quinone reductase
MKSKMIRFYKTGGPEVLKLEEVEVPSPSPLEVTVKHYAIGVNMIDTYYRTGLYSAALPSGLGSEAAGVVEAVGESITHFKIGDRVAYAQSALGAYTERRNVSAAQLVKIPSLLSFEDAAASLLKGLTVEYLFKQTYQVSQGETILFHAAAGGVGLIACQWARHLGVKLIGTVSSPEKAAIAKAHGAWETIDYTKEDVAQRVFEMTRGEKVAVVYDSVGKSTWENSLNCLRPRGLMVSYGNTSGAVTNVDLGILAQKGSLFVTRPTLGSYFDTSTKLHLGAQKLFDLMLSGAIKIDISQKYALKDASEAHQDLASSRRVGGLILIP